MILFVFEVPRIGIGAFVDMFLRFLWFLQFAIHEVCLAFPTGNKQFIIDFKVITLKSLKEFNLIGLFVPKK